MAKLEEQVQVCKQYIQQLKQFYDLLTHAMEEPVVTPEMDEAFLKVKCDLGHYYEPLRATLGPGRSAGRGVVELITAAPSLSYLREEPPVIIAKLENDWHEIYIRLHKDLGQMQQALSV